MIKVHYRRVRSVQLGSLLHSSHTTPIKSSGRVGALWEQYGSCPPQNYPPQDGLYMISTSLGTVAAKRSVPGGKVRRRRKGERERDTERERERERKRERERRAKERERERETERKRERERQRNQSLVVSLRRMPNFVPTHPRRVQVSKDKVSIKARIRSPTIQTVDIQCYSTLDPQGSKAVPSERTERTTRLRQKHASLRWPPSNSCSPSNPSFKITWTSQMR